MGCAPTCGCWRYLPVGLDVARQAQLHRDLTVLQQHMHRCNTRLSAVCLCCQQCCTARSAGAAQSRAAAEELRGTCHTHPQPLLQLIIQHTHVAQPAGHGSSSSTATTSMQTLAAPVNLPDHTVLQRPGDRLPGCASPVWFEVQHRVCLCIVLHLSRVQGDFQP